MSIRDELSRIRQEYESYTLNKSGVAVDPFEQFDKWMEEAVRAGVTEPTAMSLATSVHGQPTLRVVLLKGLDSGGFVFYTNYTSRKARELESNPKAALNFFWPELHRQVRLEGNIEKVSEAESEAYFRSRDRESQIGAWASSQSEVIAGRHTLEERVAMFLKKYEGLEEVPRPAHWGGYRLMPHYLEFWQGRRSRLHDRIIFQLQADGKWAIERIAP